MGRKNRQEKICHRPPALSFARRPATGGERERMEKTLINQKQNLGVFFCLFPFLILSCTRKKKGGNELGGVHMGKERG